VGDLFCALVASCGVKSIEIRFFGVFCSTAVYLISIYWNLCYVCSSGDWNGFLVWAAHSHYTRGGLKKVDETIFLYKEGPYRIMRHPGAFGGLMWPVLLPIVLSAYIPFTLLSVGAMLTMIIYAYLGLYLEEKLDIEKWGSEYQQYMKEVPKINFILGIWRLRLQKKG